MITSVDRSPGPSSARPPAAWVVVTGAGGGIGAAVVNRLLADGWSVLATDRVAPAPAAAGAAGARLRMAAMDVTDARAVQRMASDLAEAGPITGLVNVAGILQDVTSLLAMTDEAARRIWDVNYFGAQNCIQSFGRIMADAGKGSIVNITSINEVRPLPLHAYAPSKVALGALTALAAGELGPEGVRVNAVAPGFTLTPIFEGKLSSGARSAAAIERHTAMRRLVRVDEIAAAVSFLLGDGASAITGVSLPVDCGWLATAHWMDFGDRLAT